MTNLMKKTAFAAVLGCLVAAMPALAQNNDSSCMSLTMLIQGKLDPTHGGWGGTVKGLLIDKKNNITPLEGVLRYPFRDGAPTVYTGQVGHETAHPAFDFGSAGKFAAILDREIAQFSPSVTPHLDFSNGPPAFALGRTMATFGVAPQTQTSPAWSSSGWFANATGKISMAGTFLVNGQNFPVIGYWNVEVTGTLCNVAVPPQP